MRTPRGLVLVVGFSSSVCAAPADFTLDQADSFLTIGGTALGSAITPQGAGSLRSTYTGNILANLSTSTIEFVGGTGDATVTGSWQPLADGSLGSAPADYGGQFKVLSFFDAFFAIRDLKIQVTSGPLALSNAGTFDSTAITVTATDGDAAYNAAILSQMGSSPLDGSSGANQSAMASTLTITPGGIGAIATLLVPAQGALEVAVGTLGTASLSFTGQSRANVATIGGDANFDRSVDISDFSTLASNFNLPGNWRAGDFNFNGSVEIGDFSALAANFNTSAGSTARAPVPEPAAIALVIPALATRRVRRRRCLVAEVTV